MVGVPPSELKIPAFSLISGRKSVSGSPIGNRKTIEKMLDFAAEHDVKAQVETAPMADANAAMKRVRENSVRYRMVLVN